MKVSFSIGEKSRAIINTLKQSADNIEFFTYPTIQDMIRESMLRKISFNRIVFSSEILSKANPEGDLRQLNEFIKTHSDSTELVLIAKSNGGNPNAIVNIFDQMFNSPMYTPIILDKATPKSLLQVVGGNIAELRATYYTVGTVNDKVIISGSGNNEDGVAETVNVQQPSQEKKKGLLGRFLGTGNKKSVENAQPVVTTPEVPLVTPLPTDVTPEDAKPFSDGPQSVFSGYGDENVKNNQEVKNEGEEKLEEREIYSTPLDENNPDAGFYEVGETEDDLSVADFGSQHSDTGFLDEDDDKEMEEIAKSLEKVADSYQEEVIDEVKEVEVEEYEETPEENIAEEVNDYEEEAITYGRSEIKDNTNVFLYTAIRGTGLTQLIVDEAVNLVENDGLKVLVVDLDYKENGLLSYVNTEEFYKGHNYEGIPNLRIYSEDGVDVLSNGYGSNVSSEQIADLLNKVVVEQYDKIILDCPADCLDCIALSEIKMCNVLITSKCDVNSLVSTSLALTNRDNVSLDVEREIMTKSSIRFIGGYSRENIDWVKEICMFANGSWLE